ncbi:MAG: DUF4265 domain-containing protein, partial [Propionibacteriaceae bacterium]|nr:DUF4265 domain-containing protein [Propionibacteriaceae bacterium]
MVGYVVVMMSQSLNKYSLHRNPVWRDRVNNIILAQLPDEPPYQLSDGARWFEELWCRQISEDEFEVCCIPFFLYDIALGDVVKTHLETVVQTESGDRQHVVSCVVSRSGRYVFRVYFEESMRGNRDTVEKKLTELGALTEWSSANLLAVDARDADHGQQIADYLFEQQNLDQLVY